MPSNWLPSLTDDDLGTLADLLARFAVNHLDQWETLRIDLPGGPVDVNVGPGTEDATGRHVIWPRGRGSTGASPEDERDEESAVDRTSVLLSIQRALWGQVTPNLRGVGASWQSKPTEQIVRARFLYAGPVGEVERECTSLAETYMIADFPEDVDIIFTAVEDATLDLLPTEEWVYLRWEPDEPPTRRRWRFGPGK